MGVDSPLTMLQINTSQLGQNMIDLPGNDNSTISKGDRSDSIPDTLTDKRKEITDEVMGTVEDGLNAFTSDVVDELAEAIRVSE